MDDELAELARMVSTGGGPELLREVSRRGNELAERIIHQLSEEELLGHAADPQWLTDPDGARRALVEHAVDNLLLDHDLDAEWDRLHAPPELTE